MTFGALAKGRISRLAIMAAACIAVSGAPAYAAPPWHQPTGYGRATDWGGRHQDQGNACGGVPARDGRWGSAWRRDASCGPVLPVGSAPPDTRSYGPSAVERGGDGGGAGQH